jgi:hypothetical protein
MDSRTQKPSQPHYIINLATFLSQKEPTDSADEAKIEAVMHYKKHTGLGAFEARAGVERLSSLQSMIESLLF